MAPLVSKKEIQDELSVFDNIENDRYYKDFVDIGSFLSDKAAVIQGLRSIEERIIQNALTAWRATEDYRGRAALVGGESANSIGLNHFFCHLRFQDMKRACFKKVVTRTLTTLEIDHGFQLSGSLLDPRVQYYLGAMEEDAFRRQIRDGRPPGKDPFVDPGHGEYTHRLQWCALMSPGGIGWSQQGKVVSVYRAIGNYAAPEGSYYGFQWGLWDALCDRDNGTAAIIPFKAAGELLDFRCPNNLNTFIREHGNDHGLKYLQAFAVGRYDKRTASREGGLEYAARKALGVRLDSLNMMETSDLNRRTKSHAYAPRDGWV